MERISADECREHAWYQEEYMHEALLRAAHTIEEMDKDIAIYEHELDALRQQLWQEREGSEERG